MRLGTNASSVKTGGVLLTPGTQNEIGRVPGRQELFCASDVPLRIYVVEEI